jgi:D-hydroxyproline dehydrogenase subunit gamma
MPEQTGITVKVNGADITVAPGTTVATAILMCGTSARVSVTGEQRGPLCGMGICFECRATINGDAHRRTCLLLCEQGMDVRTA